MLTSEDKRYLEGKFATKEDVKSTQRDIAAIKEELGKFTTKEDLKAFATKDDLKTFATKDDLKAFATKQDLKSFATKDDLKAFATKKDLKAFPTKDDLKAFATKDDLRKEVEGLAIMTSEGFDAVREEFVQVNSKLDALTVTVTQDHDFYIRKLRSSVDKLNQRTGLTD